MSSTLRRRIGLACAAVVFGVGVNGAAASPWRVDAERSSFVVLTHRAGLAAGLAHDHLIVARAPSVEMTFDPDDPSSAHASLVEPVLALEVDPAAERAALGPRLRTLGALDRDLPPVPEDHRPKVRAAMLDAHQLFAERFPEIRATLDGLAERGGEAPGARVALGWNARLRLEVRGEAVERIVPLRWEVVDGVLHAELLAELRFTEFRIEPYSAVLGTVRNEDLFHVYVDLYARPAP